MRYAVCRLRYPGEVNSSTFATVIGGLEKNYAKQTLDRAEVVDVDFIRSSNWFFFFFLSFPGGMVVKSIRSGGATHNWRNRGEFRQREK